MDFSPNNIFLYGIAGGVIIFVLVQALFFLIRAYKRAQEIRMDMKKVRGIIVSSAVFSIAPAVSILLGVITLSKFLGLPLPWLRMSVIGAITYELPAATSTATALGVSLSETVTDAEVYAAIAWVMTLGIMPSIILVPLLLKKIQGGLLKMKKKDDTWGGIFITAMFLGMISAFSGMVFAHVREGIAGWIPVMVLLFSSLCMAACGLLIKKAGWKWLENYALPLCMLFAMAFAVAVNACIG